MQSPSAPVNGPHSHQPSAPLSPEQSALLKQTRQMITILWGALLASQGLLVFVLNTIAAAPAPEEAQVPGLPPEGFYAIALAIMVAAIFVPKVILANAKRNVREWNQQTISSVLLVPNIIRFALCEAITMTGFALALTNHDMKLLWPFLAVGMLGMLLSFPSEERINAMIRQ